MQSQVIVRKKIKIYYLGKIKKHCNKGSTRIWMTSSNQQKKCRINFLISPIGKKRVFQKQSKDMIKKMYFKKQKERPFLKKYTKQKKRINYQIPEHTTLLSLWKYKIFQFQKLKKEKCILNLCIKAYKFRVTNMKSKRQINSQDQENYLWKW